MRILKNVNKDLERMMIVITTHSSMALPLYPVLRALQTLANLILITLWCNQLYLLPLFYR